MNLNSNTEGSVKLCCSINHNIHATQDGREMNFATDSIESMWNSEYMQTVRQQMLNGERPEACDVCWRLEDMGIQSSRQSAFSELKDLDIHIKDYKTTKPPLPNSLELRLGNFCNLRCNSCWSLSSDRVMNERRKIYNSDKNLPQWLNDEWEHELTLADNANWNWWMSDEFMNTMKKLAPNLKRLYLTGGEPTLIKRNIEIMQMLLDAGNNQCYVALTTNLTNWNEVFFNTLSCFDNGEFQISIDHIREKNHYVRYPTQWKHIEENLQKLYYTFPTHWKVKHYTVFQTYNYDAVPDILDWVFHHRSYWDEKEQQRLYIWSPIILESPRFLDVRIIQEEYKNQAIEAIKSFKPKHQVSNIWWEHGAEQCIKILQDKTLAPEYCAEYRQKFREYTDTLDRHRGTVWYQTFPSLAEKVFLDG